MRIWHSLPLRYVCIAAVVFFTGCGSDFGGDVGQDGSTVEADASTDRRSDGAAQADSGPADSRTSTDARAQGDSPMLGDGGALGDGASQGDSAGQGDSRPDMGNIDVRADAIDARLDISADTARNDASEAGADGITGPGCGNGQKEGTEECDDGNLFDFDSCSSLCTDRRSCTCCVRSVDPARRPCQDVEGDAQAGPKMGVPKAQLCQELYTCLLRSRCGTGDNGSLVECYCGAGNVPAIPSTCIAEPRGPCVAELEAGMEAEGTTWMEKIPMVINRLYDANYGGGEAGGWWNNERTSCPADCGTPPVWLECRNPDPPDGGASEGGASDGATSDSATSDTGTTSPDASVFDGAAPGLDRDCRDCMSVVLGLDGAADSCDSLVGNAAGGPAMGVPLQQLCRETVNCFHQTNCHANAVYECYCGTAIDQGTCSTATTIPSPGACKNQLDRSLEIPPGSAGSVALARITDPIYAGGVAGVVATFENTPGPDGCYEVCIPYTPTLR